MTGIEAAAKGPGSDPEAETTKAGNQMAILNFAIDDDDGENTAWLKSLAFGERAEIAMSLPAPLLGRRARRCNSLKRFSSPYGAALTGFPRRVIEAGDICSVGASSTKLHRESLLPRDTNHQFIADLEAERSCFATSKTGYWQRDSAAWRERAISPSMPSFASYLKTPSLIAVM